MTLQIYPLSLWTTGALAERPLSLLRWRHSTDRFLLHIRIQMSETRLTQQLRRTFFSPTLENSSPCLDTSPQTLVGGSIDEASPRISTQLRWSFGVRRWISNPRLFSLTQRGTAWRSNKSQCGWQGDCTSQLQRSGVGLAPDHQMLQADGQGGGAGFWLFLRTTGEPIQRAIRECPAQCVLRAPCRTEPRFWGAFQIRACPP